LLIVPAKINKLIFFKPVKYKNQNMDSDIKQDSLKDESVILNKKNEIEKKL
jgi:hypothetical protein